MDDLAEKLVAASGRSSRPDAKGMVLVNENLRLYVTRFAGAEGFASLLQRALALASETLPTLQGATVDAQGRVECPEGVLSQNATLSQEAALAVTLQLLELLVTFIGEPLTRRIVRQACPETSPEELVQERGSE